MIRSASLTCLAGLVLLSIPTPARAVLGEDRAQWFAEPGFEWLARPRTTPDTRLERLPPEFVREHGIRWQQRRFGPGGLFRSVWGRGIHAGRLAGVQATAPPVAHETFWHEHAYLLPAGVVAADLQFTEAFQVQDVQYFAFVQTVGDTPVRGSGAMLAGRDGRIPWFVLRCFPVLDLPERPGIGPGVATDSAVAFLESRVGPFSGSTAELVVVPDDDGLLNHLAFEVAAVSPAEGPWTVYVDATDGSVLAARSERRTLQATVAMSHHERHPASPFISSPAAHIGVTHADGFDHADETGSFTDSHASTTASVTCEGEFSTVINRAGDDLATISGALVDGDTYLWGTDGQEHDQAQLDAYIFTAQARSFAQEITPGLAWVDEPLTAYVNISDTCNAYYDGTINFYRSGGGCNNSAMIADVVFHEYGHGLHIHSLPGGWNDYWWDTGEAFADATSFLITGSSLLAPHFYEDGSGIRDVEPDLVYPEDLTGECHADGLILGGALWDLRALLVEELGEDDGLARMNHLFAQMLQTTSAMTTAYEAALMADDDNGDLADGTPHFCVINEAFAGHGFAENESASFAVSFEPMAHGVPADQPVRVRFEVAGEQDCELGDRLGGVRLAYSLDGLNWSTKVLSESEPGVYGGSLPEQPHGTTLLYTLEYDDLIEQSTVTRPSNPVEPYFRLFVGELPTLVETTDSPVHDGWWHLDPDTGLPTDNWEWGFPLGEGGDPDDVDTAFQVWGNDLGGNLDGLYEPNSTAILRTPSYDLRHATVARLRFLRWLTIEDAKFDEALVQVNGHTVWRNTHGTGESLHIDDEWIPVDIDLTPWAAGNASVQVSWHLSADAFIEHGGWNIAQVHIVGRGDPPPGNPPLPTVRRNQDPGALPYGTLPQPAEVPGQASAGCACAPSHEAGDGGEGVLVLAPLLAIFAGRRRIGF